MLSDVLNTRACSMMSLDQDWVPTMQRALAVGLDAGCDEQAGRAYMNYHAALVDEGRVADSERVFLEGMAFCEEREVVSASNFLLSNQILALEVTGRWQEAVSTGRAHLEDRAVSPVRRLSGLLSLGRIGVRRGDADVEPLLDEGIAIAEGTREPQWLVPFRLLDAERHWVSGHPDRARAPSHTPSPPQPWHRWTPASPEALGCGRAGSASHTRTRPPSPRSGHRS